MPHPANENDLRRITFLERSLKEIIILAEKHPTNVPVQQARILAEVALKAPVDEGADWLT